MVVVEQGDRYYALEHDGSKYLYFSYYNRDFDTLMLIKISAGEERLYNGMFKQIGYSELAKETGTGFTSGAKYQSRNITGELLTLAKQTIENFKANS